MYYVKTIVLVVGILENEYSASILEGAIAATKEQDVNLIVYPMDLIDAEYADKDINRYRYQYNVLSSYVDMHNVDGVIVEYGSIVSPLDDKRKKDFLKRFVGKPTILLGEDADGYASICVDNRTGLSEVMEHLINEHHVRHFGYLSGSKGNNDAEDRLQIFRDELAAYNIPIDEDAIVCGNFSEYVDDKVVALMERHPEIEAIVCANDSMALGTMRALEGLGRKPGEDIIVTGFDDIAPGFLSEPSLTTVKADPFDIAYQAVMTMVEEDQPSFKKIMPSKMICRESCGCKGAGAADAWSKKLGVSDDPRETVRLQMEALKDRRFLENELCNVTREMVFGLVTAKERYEAILNTLRRLRFVSCRMYLYDDFIYHNKGDEWHKPDLINLVGMYRNINSPENAIYDIGENYMESDHMFTGLLSDGLPHHIAILLPLFFGQRQIGLLLVEGDPRQFMFAYDMAGQVSNTMYIIAMNEEQKRMKNALEAANNAKSRFLANMSHEIRTPINAIIGFNEMILRDNHEEGIRDYASDVKSAADSLLHLVNDILDFSRIEAGKMDLQLGEYSVRKVIESVVSMVTGRAEQKKLRLIVDCDPNLPEVLQGDEHRLQQVILNLMTNAVKYTESGEVTLSVHGSRDGNHYRLKVEVKDTGIGIKEEDLDRLYNTFDRIDEKRNRTIEGSGLGLNITLEILRLMNSQLEVKSIYGEGSTFAFEIDQMIPPEKNQSPKQTKVDEAKASRVGFLAPGVRILVVDDNLMNRKVIASLLRDTQLVVDQAESGAKCIELVRENFYDLIFLDHMMPELDGIETLEKMLSENIVDLKMTPVVVLTANAIVGAKENYLQSGFTDYMSKPVLPKALMEMLLKHLPEEKIILCEE